MALTQRKLSEFLMGEQRLAMDLNENIKEATSSTKDIKKPQAGRPDPLSDISLPNALDVE